MSMPAPTEHGSQSPGAPFPLPLLHGRRWMMAYQAVAADPEPDVCLRTVSRSDTPPRDCDGEIAVAWFAAVFPGWPLERALKAARKALKRGTA